MTYRRTVIIYFFILLFNCACSQSPLYDINTLQKIDIFFSQPDWEDQLHYLKATTGDYLMADSVVINGVNLDSAGIKFKGSSSYDTSFAKNPLHIKLDAYKENMYGTYSEIKLSNGYQDPSMIREVLSYALLKNYMHCSKANFAQVYINNRYIGLYSNAEDISKEFCATHFQSLSTNTFVKCNPELTPGPYVKSNLKYISSFIADYNDFYQLQSDYGWYDLVQLCDMVTNQPAQVHSYIDMDRVIWMLAFDNLCINLDSYMGVFAQNYYLFRDNNHIFNPVIWDLNMCFGGFPFAGSSNSSMAALTIANMKVFPIDFHGTDPYWPLINIVAQNETYRKKYIAHMRTLINEMFAGGYYLSLAGQLQTLIDTALYADTNKFFSYAQFQSGLISDVSIGNYSVPGINNLMTDRINYLQAQPEFIAQPPIISNIVSTFTLSSLTANITAHVENSIDGSVFLGFRISPGKKFGQFQMYDDGNHNDGQAGDGTFGINIMADLGNSQFYLYAENDSSGVLYPERAEHEFIDLTDMTGISNVQTQVSPLTVFQNPSTQNLIIQSSQNITGSVVLMDITGKVFFKTHTTLPIAIDVSGLNAGLYIIRAGNWSTKVVLM